MSEGKITFSVTQSPYDDPFEKVLVMAYVNQVGGRGSASIYGELSPDEARHFAAEILRVVEIVEKDQRR